MLRYTNFFYPYIKGPGLFVHVSGGSVFLSGLNQRVLTSGADVQLTANATNYLYYDYPTQTFKANTTGFVNPSYPLAIIVTNNSGITALSDQRSDGIA